VGEGGPVTDWSEQQPTIELLKQTITVPEVAEMLGLEPNSQGKITSPFNPDERTPSCHLWEDHWYDFSTGKYGDAIDLVRAFDPEMTVPVALNKIWYRALKAGREPGDVEKLPVRQVQDFTEEFYLMNAAVYDDGHAHPYFGWQKMNVPANCRIDEAGRLLIPHQDQDGIYGVKVRHPDGRKDAWPGSQFTKRLYDAAGWVGRFMTTTAVICEGESDAWALQEHTSAEVFALPSGAGSWKDSWLEDLEPFDKVWLCMDNDRAGDAARDKLTRKIGFLRVEHLRVPPLFNDAREAIAGGWKPSLA
jgi:hypothetical protein